MTNTVEMTTLAEPPPGKLLQIKKGIYWLRMPLPMKLDHINLYMIDEGDGWSLVDTGINLPDTQRIWKQIFERYCQGKPLKSIYVTHMHPDHVGLAGWLSDIWAPGFFMTQKEYLACRLYTASAKEGNILESHISFYRSSGLEQAFLDYVAAGKHPLSTIISPLPGCYRRIKDGDIVRIGHSDWSVITGEGHSFEHACLYSATLGILISGDQLLPKITSNVSVLAMEPDASPLGPWLESLQRLNKLPADTLVLPAHNKPFTGLRTRTKEIKLHHENQLRRLLAACITPVTAYHLLPVLFHRAINYMEMPLAIGECLAHLNRLIEQQLVTCVIVDNVKYYQQV